ncbi:Hypothetical protein PHPALM_11861 [Phytophthora palmivora]|uniref:Uncharacterized protein n=1 Tax=Phytophthora palmivora TaxID=4796 RepID=A0A2P4Y174_9STRA|nr:Hypothetical protein PHPALM_11861 [Phytophthora palmivora]
MPYTFERRELLRDLDAASAVAIISDDEDDEMEMLWVSCLYDRVGAPHRGDKFDEIIALREKDFRQVTRISKSSFAALHDYICGSGVFHPEGTTGPHKQRPVCVQLTVALARLGANGNTASVGEFHMTFNIAAGSVVIYTTRVLVALKAVRSQ